MEGIRRGLDISKEYLGYIKGVIEGKAVKNELEKAGNILSMISHGLLYDETKEEAKTEHENILSNYTDILFHIFLYIDDYISY